MKNTVIVLSSRVILVSSVRPEQLQALSESLREKEIPLTIIGFPGEIDFHDLRYAPPRLLREYRDALDKLLVKVEEDRA